MDYPCAEFRIFAICGFCSSAGKRVCSFISGLLAYFHIFFANFAEKLSKNLSARIILALLVAMWITKLSPMYIYRITTSHFLLAAAAKSLLQLPGSGVSWLDLIKGDSSKLIERKNI